MANEPIITITGNLTSDPDLRYISSGVPVANFTVASTPRTKNTQTGQWEDGEALFLRCSVWREYAENAAESLSKGMRVIVTGRLQARSYEHEGQRRESLELQVDEVGPALRYATAQVTKTPAKQGQTMAFQAPQADRWASPATPAQAAPQVSYDTPAPALYDEAPPF